MYRLADDVLEENKRQIVKWGVESLRPTAWASIIAEEMGELSKELLEYEYSGKLSPNLRVEAIQLATLALKIAEMTERGKR